MCLVEAKRFDIGERQPILVNAQFEQSEKFGNGKIFAIAALAGDKLNGGGPVIGLLPMRTVIDKGIGIEKLVDVFQFGQVVAIGFLD